MTSEDIKQHFIIIITPTSIPLSPTGQIWMTQFPAFSPSLMVYVVIKHLVYIKPELVQDSLYSGSWVRKFVMATSVTIFLFWSVAGRLLQ